MVATKAKIITRLTQLEIEKNIYDLNTEILRNCTAFEKEEGLCEFYTRSYFEYVDSLKA